MGTVTHDPTQDPQPGPDEPRGARPARRWVVSAAVGVVALVAASVGYAVLRDDPGRGPSALELDGTVLQADDERFVMAGTAAYLLPFYGGPEGGQDQPLAETTSRGFEDRVALIADMRANGVNTLRVPVARYGYEQDVYGLGGKQGYLDRLEQIVVTAADQDIRVVVAWWDSHNAGPSWLEDYRDVFPMMRDVREALKGYPGVVFEPFNEPSEVTWEQWEPVMSDVVRFWREDLAYDGVLILDTIDYSWSFDPEVAQRMLDLDADLRDGEPAVMFANHRYANNSTCFCDEEKAQWEDAVGQYLDDFPIVGTEYGRWTGPDFVPQEQWNEQFASHAADVAVPAGLNGYIAFVWDWVDENTMTEQDGQLNAYGRLVADTVFREHGAV